MRAKCVCKKWGFRQASRNVCFCLQNSSFVQVLYGPIRSLSQRARSLGPVNGWTWIFYSSKFTYTMPPFGMARLSNNLLLFYSDYRRSMRVRNERPSSYHQYLEGDYYDIEDPTRFERSSKYATIRTPALYDHLNDDSWQFPRQHVAHEYSGNVNQIHQPRSRAPFSYNPHRYQEPEMDLPRYKPHLHTAKYLSKMLLQEQEYLQINRKMKSQILKESSV